MLSKACMLAKLERPAKADAGEFKLETLIPFFDAQQALKRRAEMRRAVCDRFVKLCDCMTPALEAELAGMPYRDFLDTDYWAYLRDYIVMARGMRCEACYHISSLSVDSLELHHISYDHRGSEWRHVEDLKVLCRVCHAKERR